MIQFAVIEDAQLIFSHTREKLSSPDAGCSEDAKLFAFCLIQFSGYPSMLHDSSSGVHIRDVGEQDWQRFAAAGVEIVCIRDFPRRNQRDGAIRFGGVPGRVPLTE